MWSKNGTRSSQPDPSDEELSWEIVLLHGVDTYQSSCSPEPSFAVNCDCPLLFFTNAQELVHDGFGRACPVWKVKVMVRDSSFLELGCVVSLIIETNDGCDSHFFEDGDVVFGCKVGALG